MVDDIGCKCACISVEPHMTHHLPLPGYLLIYESLCSDVICDPITLPFSLSMLLSVHLYGTYPVLIQHLDDVPAICRKVLRKVPGLTEPGLGRPVNLQTVTSDALCCVVERSNVPFATPFPIPTEEDLKLLGAGFDC